jgi:nucleoside-diphosphate-sugar epimerase
MKDTVAASEHLLTAIAQQKSAPTVVLVSSLAVYGIVGLPAGATIDERTPLEPHPERRDVYSEAKHRQEQLFHDFKRRFDFPLVIVRPGVIYGPGRLLLPTRVGFRIAGVFACVGSANPLPLTYVENCAEAVALAGERREAENQAFNVVDDNLPTRGEFLRRYVANVEPISTIRVPYSAVKAASCLLQKGLFTPYRVTSIWHPTRFSNDNLKRLGWSPLISTEEGLRQSLSISVV